MGISTHVLNAMTGRPAAGMAVELIRVSADGSADGPADGSAGHPVTSSTVDRVTAGRVAAGRVADGRVTAGRVTDADGRIGELCADPTPGIYRLTFATGPYFTDLGVNTFYPEVAITVQVEDGAQHYHVPLLLSPYAYSTYRGS